MACWTRRRVSSVTCGYPLTTLDTVLTDTPARSATCLRPTRSPTGPVTTRGRLARATPCRGDQRHRSPVGNARVAGLTGSLYNDVPPRRNDRLPPTGDP